MVTEKSKLEKASSYLKIFPILLVLFSLSVIVAIFIAWITKSAPIGMIAFIFLFESSTVTVIHQDIKSVYWTKG